MKIEIGLGTVAIVLVVLKLAGILDIGWLWVLAPIWIPLVFIIMALLFMLIICGACAIIDKIGG